jgi:hypothetical protein
VSRRASVTSGRQFRQQQRPIKGVDDATKSGAAFLTFEFVGFESLTIKMGRLCSTKRKSGLASRAPERLGDKVIMFSVTGLVAWAIIGYQTEA